MKKNKKDSVLKAGLGYTLGNYLLKGISFLTVPLFARLMETSDFGIYNTFLSYEGILYLFIGFALHSSIKNAKYKFGNETLDQYVSSIMIIPLVSAFCAVLISFIVGSHIVSILKIDIFQLVLIVIMSLSSSILYIYQSRLILDYKTKNYLYLSYFNALGSVGFSLIFMLVVFPKERYMGRILGAVTPMSIIAVWILYSTFRKARPKYNNEFWKYGIKISLPIIPHGIGQIVLSSFDRIMITEIINATASGLYSFAYTLYSIIAVAGTSISAVFEPWAYERLNKNERQELQNKASDFVFVLAILCVGTLLVAPELILVLGSRKYIDSLPALSPIVIGGFFSMAYMMPATVEYYTEKTKFIALGTVMAAVINIGLNAIFIPRYGFVAAAYTTLVSYGLYYVFHSVVAYKIVQFNIVPIKVSLISIFGLVFTAILAEMFVGKIVIRIIIGVVVCVFALLRFRGYICTLIKR